MNVRIRGEVVNTCKYLTLSVAVVILKEKAGNTKGESITVPLTSGLTNLD
jgi:hypothetical protein